MLTKMAADINIHYNSLHGRMNKFEAGFGYRISSRLSGKFHPRYFPVEFAGIFRPGKYAQSGKYGKYGKYDFGLVIM